MTADSRKIVPLDAGNYPNARSEYFLATCEQIVQGILEVRRRLGELASDLRDVLLIALLNLILEELLQGAITQTFLSLLRKVRNQIGDERSREALCFRVRIVREERIDRRPRSGWCTR